LVTRNSDSENPLGRFIAVQGKGGKTTLSKALARRFDLGFIEQDEIRHQANWVELSNEEHRQVLNNLFDEYSSGWVSDGNYRAISDMIFPRVETLIVLALPWRVMLWRTFKRTFKRVLFRQELWNGNKETFRGSFLSKNSVVYDLWRRRELFRNVASRARENAPENCRVIVIESAR